MPTEIETYTIITGKPNRLVENIHTRMPVIIDQADFDRWLTAQQTCSSRTLQQR